MVAIGFVQVCGRVCSSVLHANLIHHLYLFSGDSGSPVSAQTARGRIVVAIVQGGFHTCDTEGYRYRNGTSTYVRVSEAMPWLTRSIMEYSRCHCLEPLFKKWIIPRVNIIFVTPNKTG